MKITDQVAAESTPEERIIAAARKLFFKFGFQRVSTDQLAKEASISKATLYRHFGGLEDVLIAMAVAEGNAFEIGVPAEVSSLRQLEEALVQYSTNILKFLNKPDTREFCSLMSEYARIRPDVTQDFYHAAYGRSLSTFTRLFDSALRKKIIDSDLPASSLAEILLGSLEGVPMLRTQLGFSEKPFANPSAWSLKCVHVVLCGATKRRPRAGRATV